MDLAVLIRQLQSKFARQVLQLAVESATGRTAAFGTGTLTFTASPLSATLNVNHGLETTPAYVFCQSDAGIAYCLIQVNSRDDTKFVAQGRDTADVNRSGTNTFYWLAIA